MVNFTRTEATQLIHQVVTPLIAVRDGREEYVSGSAVVVAPGWAITAYHVIEDFLKRYAGSAPSTGEVTTLHSTQRVCRNAGTSKWA
jgi:hypothetical protein